MSKVVTVAQNIYLVIQFVYCTTTCSCKIVYLFKLHMHNISKIGVECHHLAIVISLQISIFYQSINPGLHLAGAS